MLYKHRSPASSGVCAVERASYVGLLTVSEGRALASPCLLSRPGWRCDQMRRGTVSCEACEGVPEA